MKEKKSSSQRIDYLKELRERADISYSKKPEDRTYKDRRDIWDYERFANFDPNNWSEGEDIEITDGEKLIKNEIKHQYDNSDFPEWFRECGKWFGKKVIYNEVVYTLIGMDYSYMDYYYILQDKNGKKHYCSCVGKIELYEDK